MEEVYIYIDEAGNPNVNSFKDHERFFQVGAAVFAKEPKVEIIEKAMKQLKFIDVSKLNSSDLKTIRRGYFHASVDGPEAKSKLMEQVNSFNIEFYVYKFDKRLYVENISTNLYGQQQLHFHLIHLASTIGLNYGVRKINLFVAQRDKSFPHGSEMIWIESFYNTLINSSAVSPQLKMSFPKLVVKIVNGQTPRIQICDLLLWATQRNNRSENPKSDWFDRIKKRTSSRTTIPNDPLSMSDFYVNDHISPNFSKITYEVIWDEVDKLEQNIDKGTFYSLLAWMEDVIKKLYFEYLSAISHLNTYLESAVKIIEQKRELTIEEVKQICKVFIMIFDTAKIYEKYNDELMIHALLAKRYAGIILTGDDMRWIFMAKEWGSVHPLFNKE
ncbi:DUF3800 domain-containing protein [Bacillus toyonensis]